MEGNAVSKECRHRTNRREKRERFPSLPLSLSRFIARAVNNSIGTDKQCVRAREPTKLEKAHLAARHGDNFSTRKGKNEKEKNEWFRSVDCARPSSSD